MDLDALLRDSRATDEFKRDVQDFHRRGRASLIATNPYAPPIKVLRVIKQLLAEHPDAPVRAIKVDGRAGCSDFTGVLHVETDHGSRQFEFTWCCRWRAELEGWVDYFGFPDQIRAAREYDWRCFQRWAELGGGQTELSVN